MRVLLKGSEDVAEFTEVNGTWVSEDCEPVRVETAWQRHSPSETPSEADCVCSRELASRLLHLLLNADEESERTTSALPSELCYTVKSLA
jgi:hypothetical protein